jgi:hypothetical protein
MASSVLSAEVLSELPHCAELPVLHWAELHGTPPSTSSLKGIGIGKCRPPNQIKMVVLKLF